MKLRHECEREMLDRAGRVERMMTGSVGVARRKGNRYSNWSRGRCLVTFVTDVVDKRARHEAKAASIAAGLSEMGIDLSLGSGVAATKH